MELTWSDDRRPYEGAEAYAHLLATFWEIASEVLEREVPSLPGDTPIAELGIESLPLFEVIGSMERHFKIRLADDELSGIQTVDDLVHTIAGHLSR